MAEDRISELQDKLTGSNVNWNKEKRAWEKNSFFEARGTELKSQHHVIGGPGGEENEKEARPTEITSTARDFPNLAKDVNKQIPEAQKPQKR